VDEAAVLGALRQFKYALTGFFRTSGHSESCGTVVAWARYAELFRYSSILSRGRRARGGV
jgi:hypothetical protein